MRFIIPATLLVIFGSLAEATSVRPHAVNFGRSQKTVIESRHIEAALDVLRRANFDLEEHVLKRSSTYSYESNGDECYCKPKHHPHHSSWSSTSPTHKPTTHHSTWGSNPTPPGNHKPTPSISSHKWTPTTTSSQDKPWSSSSSSSASKSTGTPTCPSGWKHAGQGDTFLDNDNDLIDAKNLDINIDILSFLSPSSTPSKSSAPASSSPKCQDKYCCYKSGYGSSGSRSGSWGSGSGSNKPTCPSGYSSASSGQTFISNDNDLIDAKDLTLNIDILSYSSATATPSKSSAPASSSPKCQDKYCCYKSGSGSSGSGSSGSGSSGSGSGGSVSCPSGYTKYSQGNTIVQNNNDVINLSDLTINLNILSYTSPSSTPTSTSSSPGESPKCEASSCCVKQTSKKGNTVIENNNSLIDASGAKIDVCILSVCV